MKANVIIASDRQNAVEASDSWHRCCTCGVSVILCQTSLDSAIPGARIVCVPCFRREGGIAVLVKVPGQKEDLERRFSLKYGRSIRLTDEEWEKLCADMVRHASGVSPKGRPC